jgi:hypothetical protein
LEDGLMRRSLMWCPVLLLFVAAGLADDKPKGKEKADKAKTAAEKQSTDKAKADKPKSPGQEELDAIKKDLEKAQQEYQNFVKQYQAAKTDAQRKKLEPALAKFRALPGAFASRFLKLAKKHPQSDAAFDALTGVAQLVQGGADLDKAYESLTKDYAQDEKITRILRNAQYSNSPAAEKLLRAVMERNKEREIRGQACFSLAQYLKIQSESKDRLALLSADMVKHFEKLYGADLLKRIKESDPAKLSKESEQLFDRFVKDYAEVKARKQDVESAKEMLYVLRNLAVGKVAPEIEGEDIDGKKFKLSDYRRKVVVLHFFTSL